MMRFRMLILSLVLALLTACAPPADPLAYQSEALAVTLTGTVDALALAAELTLAPVPDGISPDARGFTLVYTAPPSLAGLTLCRDDAGLTLSRGPICVADPDGRFSAMALPAALFCIDCPIGGAAVVAQNGRTLNRVTAADDEGEYTLWLDEAGYPRRIEGTVDGRRIALDVQYPSH